ncbi:MAG: hypothetical protein U9Q97_07900 [Acidobacteriota bacterium]|nr:hypothetical protein [Acidobacteriota bacterium]
MDKRKKYPEGHFVGKWMGISIAIFSGFGIPLSIVLKNPGLIGIGPAVGVAFGIAIGSSIESKYKKEGKIRPLTEDEKKEEKNAINCINCYFNIRNCGIPFTIVSISIM